MLNNRTVVEQYRFKYRILGKIAIVPLKRYLNG